MTPESRTVQVEIFGQTYRLRADENPEYVERLAAYVDEKMREMSRQTKAVDTLKVAVLAALNIADERLRGHESPSRAGGGDRQDRSLESIDRRLQECSRLLDEALAG